MTRCEPIAILLTPYAAGELSELETRRVEVHLATCPACREELARELQLRGLAAALPPVRCPEAVTGAILAAVDADTLQQRRARRADRRHIATWPRTLAAASLLAAAVLLVLVLPRNPVVPGDPAQPGYLARSGGPDVPLSGDPAWTQAELQQARTDVAWALAFTADIIDRTEKRSLVDALRLLQPAVRSAAGEPGAPAASGGQG